MNKFKIFTRYYLSKIPKLYFLFYHLNEKFFKKKKFIKFKLKKNMDFLIDGFPRSGNTYAYFAFLHMQKKKYKIIHHFHHEYGILYAILTNIPNMILIRKPDDAVKSLLIRNKNLDHDDAFLMYYIYYKIVYNYRQSLLIIKFESIINNFNYCVNQVNLRFKTNFIKKKISAIDKKKIFKKIDLSSSHHSFNHNKKINKKNLITLSARPFKKRNLIKISIKKNYWRNKAYKIYYLLNNISK